MTTTTSPAVPEQARFCRACDGSVGRGRGGRPGPERGVCRWCGAPFDLRPARRVGEVVDGARGSYRITAALLHGSRGWIYAATDVAIDSDTDGAVVLTRLEGPEGRAAGDLAVDETAVLLGLDVPGLVRARDVVTAGEAAGPARHLVLDHVSGVGLDSLREGGPLGPVSALDAAVDAAAVLAELHGQDLLHTDLTPANLRRTPDAGLTVMDLGSLRRADDHTSDVWGTTGYLAPEITPGGAGPSVPSEVYGLARTVAVLIAEFDHRRSYALRLPDPASVRVLAEHPALTDLLRRATDVDPAARHPDVTAFAAEATAVRDDLIRRGLGGDGPTRTWTATTRTNAATTTSGEDTARVGATPR